LLLILELFLRDFRSWKNKIDYLLLRPEFEKYSRETGKRLHFPYKYENHWNTEGHALAVQLIYNKLKDDKLIPIELK